MGNIKLNTVFKALEEELFKPLEAKLDALTAENRGHGFSMEYFMSLYTQVYNACQEGSENQAAIYKFYGQRVSKYVSTKVFKRVEEKRGISLLQELMQIWENHKLYIKWVSKAFAYLDRCHIERVSNNPVKVHGMSIFRHQVFDKLEEAIKIAIIECIGKEREGNLICEDVLRSNIDMYVELNLNDKEPLLLYQEFLEGDLLHDAYNFYCEASASWISDTTCLEYVLKGQEAIEAEQDRCLRYLPDETTPRMLNCVNRAVYCNHLEELLKKDTAILHLLNTDKREDLKLIYEVLSCFNGGKKEMSNYFRKYIIQEGENIIKFCAEELANSSEARYPVTSEFILLMLSLNSKCKSYVETCFISPGDNVFDPYFVAAMKDAFESLVNPDVRKYNFSHMLAGFCDILLRKNAETSEISSNSADLLKKAVDLFNYIIHKDAFLEFYRSQLAGRLIQETSTSLHYEREMINLLKLKCGSQFTSRLETMLDDTLAGSTKMEQFLQSIKDEDSASSFSPNGVEFKLHVLTLRAWPTYSSYEIQLPKDLDSFVTSFAKFYTKKESHRKLSWAHMLGSAVLRFNKGSESYRLVCNTYQACVLLLFNSHDVLSMKEISDLLQMETSFCVTLLESLTNPKLAILQCLENETAISRVPGQGFSASANFVVSRDFSEPRKSFRLPMLVEEVTPTIEIAKSDITPAIEAAIVRLMKARKVVSSDHLITEVSERLKGFKPTSQLINDMVENLISRDYMRRSDSDPSSYVYVA